MKASELRLGNLIEQGSVFNITHHFGRLGVIVIGEYDSFPGDFYPEDKIEPIPLAEENLLQFGFEKEQKRPSFNHGHYFSKHFEDGKYCFAFAKFRNDWGFYQEYTDSPYPRDEGKKYFVSHAIKYVHQLQNLYHALTGEELTIKE